MSAHPAAARPFEFDDASDALSVEMAARQATTLPRLTGPVTRPAPIFGRVTVSVYDLLLQDGPLTRDQIRQRLDMSFQDVYYPLDRLTVRHIIMRLPGDRYAINPAANVRTFANPPTR